MNPYLLWAISSTIIALFAIWLLFKKQSTTNEIDKLKQKNKHVKSSNIDNNIHADISQETKRKRRKLNKLFNKKD